ncbi:MAG: hypothetical protein WC302_00140 [Candidatus Paceibacterota bacterium]
MGYSIANDCCSNSLTNRQLNEVYCNEEGNLTSIGYECPNGCSNGACLAEPLPTTPVAKPKFWISGYSKTDSLYEGDVKFNWEVKNADFLDFRVTCQDGLAIKDAATGEDFACGEPGRRMATDGVIYLIFTNNSASSMNVETKMIPVVGDEPKTAYAITYNISVAPQSVLNNVGINLANISKIVSDLFKAIKKQIKYL